MNLKQQALEVTRQIEKTVEQTFSKLTNETIEVQTYIGRHFDWKEGKSIGHRITGKIEFINEEGHSDFGSDISYSYNQEDGLKINVGTCGEYGKGDKYQIERVMLLAQIFANITEIENTFNSFDITSINEFNKEQAEIERAKVKKELEERENKKQEIEKSFEVGQVYKDEHREYKITKITPKFVTFNESIKNKKEELVSAILNKKLVK